MTSNFIFAKFYINDYLRDIAKAPISQVKKSGKKVIFVIFYNLKILSDEYDIFVPPYRAVYTPGIYAEGYIVFAFPFVRSYVRMFVRSFVRSYFLPSRGICVKVLR